MKSVTFTTKQIAEELVASIGLKLAGFISKEEHLTTCSAWMKLFGHDFFDEAVEIAKNGQTSFTHRDGSVTFYDVDIEEFVMVKYAE